MSILVRPLDLLTSRTGCLSAAVSHRCRRSYEIEIVGTARASPRFTFSIHYSDLRGNSAATRIGLGSAKKRFFVDIEAFTRLMSIGISNNGPMTATEASLGVLLQDVMLCNQLLPKHKRGVIAVFLPSDYACAF